MIQRPKIMFVIDSLGAGGAERSLVELLPHLHRAGADSLVVTLKPTEIGFEADARSMGIRIVQIGEDRLVRRVKALRRLIKSEDPDLVHTTLFDADIVGRLAAAGSRATVSVSLVNTSYDTRRYDDPHITRWKLEMARHIDGWTARHLCDRFHAITHAVERASIDALGISPDRVTVVPRGRDRSRLGLPSEERRARVRNQLGLNPSGPVLLNIGRQEFQKGQQHLLEAVALLREDYGDLVLLIAGREGNATADLKNTIDSLDLGVHVRLLGHRTDIGDLLSATDLFVFPSVYEGLGGVLIEAALLRAAIVATDLPAIREIFGEDYPYLAAPADPRALAASIDELLSDKKARDLAAERVHGRVVRLEETKPQQLLAESLVCFAVGSPSPSAYGVGNQ